MTGHAGNGRNGIPLLILIKGEIFLVDPAGHLIHMPGDVLFRLGIAGEIQLVGGTVRRWRVTEIALHAKRGLPTVHDLVEVIMTDVPGQHL